MILKVLRESGFDFSKLPPDINNAVSLLDRNTAGTFESDSQKMNVLDDVVFRSIKNLYPADEAVRITDELVSDVDSEIVNDGFNTVLREDFTYQTTPEIDENFNHPVSVVYEPPVAPHRFDGGGSVETDSVDDIIEGTRKKSILKTSNVKDGIVLISRWVPRFSLYRHSGIISVEDGIPYVYDNDPDNPINDKGGSVMKITLEEYLKTKEVLHFYDSGLTSEQIQEGVKKVWHKRFNWIDFNCETFIEEITGKPIKSNHLHPFEKIGLVLGGVGLVSLLAGDGKQIEFPRKANKKESRIITETFGENWLPIIEKFIGDIIDLYPYEQWNRDGNGFKYKTIGASSRKDGYFYLIGEDDNVYLVHNFSLFPTEPPSSEQTEQTEQEHKIWYHGTDSRFERFDISKSKGGSSMFGLWFTDDPELAKMFGENVYKAKLSFKNPKTISFDKWDEIRENHAKDEEFFKNWRKELLDKGYDSLYIEERISDFAGQKVKDPNTIAVFNQDDVEMLNQVAADGKVISDKDIIGYVTTKPMSWKVTSDGNTETKEVPSETYAVISTFEANNHTFYVTNVWYDEAKGKPLVIVDDIAEKYDPVKAKLIKKSVISDFQSGSSLDFHEGQIFIIGDDAKHVLSVDTDFNEIRRFRIFDDGTDTNGRIAKGVKSDLETSTIVEIGGIPHILILGSGARDNRAVGFMLNTDLDIITDKFRYNNFVSRLKENGIKEVNIEGSTVVDGKFLLVNRGNKTNPDSFLIVTDSLFWENQDSASIFLSRIQLPDKDAGVSEITYDKKTDTLFFTATIEDTTNAIDDGRIGDSYLGYVLNISKKLTSDTIQADEFINLTKVSPEFSGQKIEGLCVEKRTDNYHIVNLVSDNDNDESHLFKVRITFPGCDFDQKTGTCNNGCKTDRFNNGGLIAPNGKPSNLTPEQYKLVRTPAFKAWFGDWEKDPHNASKVVDENGEPRVMYHGTTKKFNVFKGGSRNDWQYDDLFFVTPDKDLAKGFGQSGHSVNKKIRVIPLFVSAKNIFDVDNKKDFLLLKNYFLDSRWEDYMEQSVYEENWTLVEDKEFIEKEVIGKYDSVYVYEVMKDNKTHKNLAVLNSNQLKLADGTNTTFDPNNPDIRYDDGGGVDSPAVNSLTDIVENYRKKFDKAQPAYYGFRGYIDRNLSEQEVKEELERFKLEYDPKYPIANLPDHPNHSVCRGASFGLAKALNEAGFKARVIAGWYLNAGWGYHAEWSSLSSWPPSFLQGFNAKEHWWVEADGLYIDITSDQFHPYEPKKQEANRILIGKKEDMIMESHYPIKREFIGTAGEMTTDLNALAAKMTEKLAKKQLDRHSIDKIKQWVDKNGKKLSPQQLIDLKAQLYNEAYSSEKHSYPEIVKEITYGNGGLIAPNGKPSNLTPEQYRLVRTPEFKAWFGDWENSPETASKVVDENGEPLVVWHGSNNIFDVFDTKTIRYENIKIDEEYPDILTQIELWSDTNLRDWANITESPEGLRKLISENELKPIESANDGTDIPPVDEGGKTGTTDIELVNKAEVLEAKEEGKLKPVKLTPDEVRAKLTELRESEPEPQLTMLSFGGGQDSFSMLYSYIHDPEFRRKYAPNDFLVVMSDTGNEHPHTYKAVKEAEQICKKHNIHFRFLTPDMGYHTAAWPDLKTNLKKNSSLLSATMQSKPCTPNLKINVVDKYMYHYMCELYGFEKLDNKKSWAFYREKFKTRARVLIGFAKDEEMRAVNSLRNHQFLPVWKKATMQYVYPMLEEGWNRETAQEIIKKYHPYVMPPSNCMLCFYQSDQELLWLEHHHPEELNEWIEMERAKQQKTIEDMPKVREMMEAETDLEKKEKLIKKLKSMEKNYGVYGTLTLPEKLKKAKEKYGHWSIEQLDEYKMSHGHCVKSSF